MKLWWLLCGRTWREQPGRIALALLAVTLGVALAFGVHLLNAAALAEFTRAARSVDGQPDLVVTARRGPLRDADLAAVLACPEVETAAPVLEGQARWLSEPPTSLALIGIDPLASLTDGLPLTPDLLPQAGPWQRWLDPGVIHLNPAAQGLATGERLRLRLAQPDGSVRDVELPRGAPVRAAGSALGVLDIAAAQALLGRLGELDRIDVRLRPGALELPLPAHLQAEKPVDAGERLADFTRAYRVNLGLLSLMALFTGSFLVFAVLSLSAAQRLPQWALLGVLGLSARQRLTLILLEGAVIGGLGSLLGLALGYGLAALGLQALGSNLGLQTARLGSIALLQQLPLSQPALVFGSLGLAATLASALGPALQVRRIAPAQVLKGLGAREGQPWPAWVGLALLGLGAGLCALPPGPAGVPTGAYAGMLALLLGGLALVPQWVHGVGRLLSFAPRTALTVLALERSRDQAGEARRSLAGVLVALALSVAMVVMIGSFRASLEAWLDQVLPAELYLRSALKGRDGQPAPLSPAVLQAAEATGARLSPQRSTTATIGGRRVTLLARPVEAGHMPLASARVRSPGPPSVFVSEAARDALGLQPGRSVRLQIGALELSVHVEAVWRDYARATPTLWMPLADYRRLTGDGLTTELALSGDPARLKAALQALPDIELASSAELRRLSLQIFDRSFAITTWLQGVALAVGLFGVAAGQSAQALARQREFGLLRHLGFSQAQLRRLLWLESSLLAGAGAVAGLLLGLALATVLVHVVNPQSFHWSMDLHLPIGRLAALMGVAFAAAVGASALAGRRALGADAIRAVKEDW